MKKNKTSTPKRSRKSSRVSQRDGQKNEPLDIADYPIGKAKVAPEIVSDAQEIAEVPAWKQRQLDALKPYKWQSGQSGNPSGRSPDMVKGIALRIAQLQAGKILSDVEQEKLRRLNIDSADITVLEAIIIDWATSQNPIKQQLYVERVAGKVANINLNAEISAGLVTRFKNKLTDSELEAIANGADAMDILFDKLPDIDADDSEVVDVDAE